MCGLFRTSIRLSSQPSKRQYPFSVFAGVLIICVVSSLLSLLKYSEFDRLGLKADSKNNISDATTPHNNYNELPSNKLPFMCDAAKNGYSSASIWSSNFDTILAASQHPADTSTTSQPSEATIRNRAILQDLSPSLLQEAIKARPRPGDVKRIIEIVENYQTDPKINRQLTILVVGGSVTEGRGCNEPSFTGGNGRQCAWAYRLETFLNTILGTEGAEAPVRIVNAASGGTGSVQGSRLIKYWMYPPQILPDGPDVIINAYGMNDSFLWGALDLPEMVRAGRQFNRILDRMNNFVATVIDAHPCRQPVIVYLDDYLGSHRQGNLIYDLTYNTVMTMAMKWYRNLAVSSADVVRRLVLADTTETMYTPKWILKSGRYKEEVHFGAGGHMLILWSIAYSALEALTSHCSDERLKLTQEVHNQDSNNRRQHQTDIHGIRPHALELVDTASPPPLTNETMLEKISEEWSNLGESRKSQCKDRDADQFSGTPCVYAWIAGPEGFTSNKGSLNGYLNTFMTLNDGFAIQDDMKDGWSRKLGFVATKPNAMATFEVKNIDRDVQFVMVDYLKSYGDKWAGSAARFTSFVKGKNDEEYKKVHEFELRGFHNATASITYSVMEDLGDNTIAKVGDSFQVQIELIGGTTFKILGLMFCNR